MFCGVYIRKKGIGLLGAEQKKEIKFGKEYIFEGMAKTRIMPPNFSAA